MSKDTAESQTPLDDLVRQALENMAQGPRMILDSFPDDPSLRSCSSSPAVVKAIASRLSALLAENYRLKRANGLIADSVTVISDEWIMGRARMTVDRDALAKAVSEKSPISLANLESLFGGIGEGNKAALWRFINMSAQQQMAYWHVHQYLQKTIAPDARIEAVR